MSTDSRESAVKTILGLTEDGMGDVVRQLLSNERFVAAVQTAVTSGLSAKRSVDKGMATMLSLVNVPTLEDVDKVKERLNELEATLAEITERVQSIDGKLSARAAKK